MKTNNIHKCETIKNPRFLVTYKGKEVKRFPYYRQAKQFVIRHNGRLFGNDICVLVDLLTGEELNNLF